MRRRATILTACVVMAVTGIIGCSDDTIHPSFSGVTLDRRVLRLPQGASIEAVEGELGAPDSEATDGDETALHYRLWQLVFTKGLLKKKSREYRPSHPVQASGAAFDHKVLSLQRGMPIAKVKARLGVPTSYEKVFRSRSIPENILRYGPWEITFTEGGLTRRTKF